MTQPAAPPLFPGHPLPDSAARRHVRALARSAPWLSTSVRISFQVPQEFQDPARGLEGRLELILRQREAAAAFDEAGRPVYQREHFTADRGRDYVATASASSWKLPAGLTSPVFTSDRLVLRRPEIAGFGDLLPLSFLSTMLDPFEIAGTEPASLDLAFDHPTYIHELAETEFAGRPVLAAVLSAGYSYRPCLADFALVPPETRTLVILDADTGICVHRRVLDAGSRVPDISLQVLAHDEYYIDSLFTAPAPTLTDVRAPIPWELRKDAGRG